MAIDVYGATWCGDCHRAKNALDRFGAAYTWHDIEQEEGAADRAVEISGQKHIPVGAWPARVSGEWLRRWRTMAGG